MQQKTFLEFPVPKKREFSVVVKHVTTYHDVCQEPGCNPVYEAEWEELYLCDCCGIWKCDKHADAYGDGPYCVACQELSKPLREAIIEFRKKLTELS